MIEGMTKHLSSRLFEVGKQTFLLQRIRTSWPQGVPNLGHFVLSLWKSDSTFPEWALFYPVGTVAPDRLKHNLQNCISPWSWLQADSRGSPLEMGLQEASWAICRWRRMCRSDLQELGLPEPCCCSATQHRAG